VKRTLQLAAAALAAALALHAQPAAAQAGKKVLFINSYHEGYPWSDGEEKGAKAALAGSGVELRFHRMDTKRHQDDAFRAKAAAKAREEIEAWKPDLVIVSDDPAVELVLKRSYKDAKVPFVFCGVNWDAAKYGLPYTNATGMLEVAPVKELVQTLRAHAKGPRIGYLSVDTETERIEAPAYAKVLGAPFTAKVLAKTYAEWKAAFLEMQGTTDMIMFGNTTGLKGFDEKDAAAFILANTRVPTGCAYDFMMPFAMLGFTKIEEEQGAWAGATALRILKGEPPSAIAIAQNHQSKILMNVKLAAAAKVVFRPEIVRNAQVVQ
jgi:ABC-type uncharacterized transport system substrate-binding protein